METVSFGIAFIAGVLSFLSPCILPLAPGYISFLSGVSLKDLQEGTEERKVILKAGITSIFFVMGFSIVFIALGASASFIGNMLAQHMNVITKISGGIIVFMGLYLTGILKLNWLSHGKHFEVKQRRGNLFSALIIGLAFGFGWTPCVGPILASILALAAAQDTMTRGMLLLAVYSLGLGIPFIITGFAVGMFMRFLEKYRRFIQWGQVTAGAFLICIGTLIFFNKLKILLKYIPF